MLELNRTRFDDLRLRLEQYTPKTKLRHFLWEFFLFGFKQAWACLFGGILLGLLIVTKFVWSAEVWLARYDFLFLCAIFVQIMLLVLRLESVREAKVILIFHVVGTVMEIFKTNAGSWTYPEHSFFHIGHVPLFSGFMYGSVGSYIARVSRIFDMRYTNYPSQKLTMLLAALIYINFFTHHFMPDLRILLFLFVIYSFGRTQVYYRPSRKFRHMPLLLGFALVALFIWIGENIGTLTSAWMYPHQLNGWQWVRFGKYSSWFLLMIISFILVGFVHRPLPPDAARKETENS